MVHTAHDAIAYLRRQDPEVAADIGIVLGTGLGGLAERLGSPRSFAYRDIPGFPTPSVEGHAGRLHLGELGGRSVACLQGRVHLYEGHPASATTVAVRTLSLLGCRTLIVTNAAGSLRTEAPAGELMLIEDHINMLGTSPLVGPNDDAFGPRFPAMTDAYDPRLRARAREVADRLHIPLHRGVYLATLGPTFETPAEIRAFAALGADAVGMSTVPEVIVARHCGLAVLGISVLTNLAAGLSATPLTHEHTLELAGRAAGALERLVIELLATWV